jgi:pyridoxal phosphate enzyme (YggS family)
MTSDPVRPVAPLLRLRERAEQLRSRITSACEAVGRDPGSVRVLPATKGRDVGYLDALHELGFDAFGESRIGEFARKVRARPTLAWEFIGRFRPEDAALVARHCRLLHSVANPEQVEALELASAMPARKLGVLLQVHLGDDPRKQGWTPAAAHETARAWKWPALTLRGVMIMAPEAIGPDRVGDVFQRGKAAFEQIREIVGPSFDTLSMGMSGDFEPAVRAGATVLRIGTYLAEAWTDTAPLGPR